MRQVAVLFARRDSHYKSMPGCDVWDADRDAMKWPGGDPVVAHPPCRAWGQLSHFAKPRAGERELALWAISQVRRFGGVLEHPINSRLWDEAGCLGWGIRDEFGGVLFAVHQSSWGHRAPKATGLYMVGGELPSVPAPGRATNTVEKMGRAERERTPPAFAGFLVELAKGCAR